MALGGTVQEIGANAWMKQNGFQKPDENSVYMKVEKGADKLPSKEYDIQYSNTRPE
jgi:hypothetical protein